MYIVYVLLFMNVYLSIYIWFYNCNMFISCLYNVIVVFVVFYIENVSFEEIMQFIGIVMFIICKVMIFSLMIKS